MDWRQYIHSDPEVLAGKPAVFAFAAECMREEALYEIPAKVA